MPGVGRGAAARQPDALADLRFERPRPAPAGNPCCRTREIDMDDGTSLRFTNLGLQHPESAIDPGTGRCLVVQVAFDPLSNALRAQGSKALIEQPAGLAELRICAIAQRQHSIAHVLEA